MLSSYVKTQAYHIHAYLSSEGMGLSKFTNRVDHLPAARETGFLAPTPSIAALRHHDLVNRAQSVAAQALVAVQRRLCVAAP
jgi:hypothetical protein